MKRTIRWVSLAGGIAAVAIGAQLSLGGAATGDQAVGCGGPVDANLDDSSGESSALMNFGGRPKSGASDDDDGLSGPLSADEGDYRVVVDFSTTDGEIKPLVGTNRGVLTTATNCSAGDSYDYTLAYQAIGLDSLRLHDDSFDSSLIFSESEMEVCSCDDSMCSATSCTTSPDACYSPASIADSWLSWSLTKSSPNDLANYDFSTTDQAYRAIIAGGFEAYLRLGEGWDGVSYVEDNSRINYGIVAGNIAAHFSDASRFAKAPGFIEIWNEPDGRFWTGPDFARDTRGVSGAYEDMTDDFARLSHAIYFWADKLGAASETIGGSGFVENGMTAFAKDVAGGGSESFPHQVLSHSSTSSDEYNFVSIHHYGDWSYGPSFDPDDTTARTSPSDMVTYLEESRAALDTFCADDEGWALEDNSCKPLHITEWMIATPSNCSASYTSGGVEHSYRICKSELAASYVSSGLTWMQHPDLDVERAHEYARAGLLASTAANHLSRDDIDISSTDTCNFGRTGPWGVIKSHRYLKIPRRSLALSLHDDIEGWDYVPVSLKQAKSVSGRTFWTRKDPLEAAKANWSLTALAASRPSVDSHVVVLSEFYDDEGAVRLNMSGLAASTDYRVTLRSLAEDYPDDGCFVDMHVDNNSDGFYDVSDVTQLRDVFARGIDLTTSSHTSTAAGELNIAVPIGGYGVVRVEISPQTAPN